MQLYKRYFISILLISQSLKLNACGIAVHNEITYRSLENYEPKTVIEHRYKDDLLDSPSYTQAGSFFPDWGYQCLGNNAQSEDAHWPTFIKTAINYIREVYPAYKYHQDNNVKGLISFIFAVMSHGMADVKWHSLDGLSDYFIVAMAKSDFHGNTEESHIAADAGAEFTLRHSNKLSYLNETWHVPIKDIREIYRRLYDRPEYKQLKRKVPLAAHIQYCMAAAFAASKIDVEFGQFMFGYYGSKSPFLVEELYDYYKGGIEDMSGSVTDCYSEMVRTFEEGAVHQEPDTLCANYFYTTHGIRSQCHVNPVSDAKHQMKKIYQHYDPITGVLALTFDPSQKIAKSNTKEDLIAQVVKETNKKQKLFQYQNPSTNDVRNNQKCTSFRENRGITFTLPTSSARLGHQIATGDFNGNGQIDMAISAPYDDQATGSVFVLNSVNQFVPNNNRFDDLDIRKVAAQILRGEAHHGRFGWSIVTLDMNHDGIDDLAIATPFSNRVDIYFGQKDSGLSETPEVIIHNIELGTVLSAVDINQDGFRDLVIGCPLCSVGGQPQVGRVFIVTSDKQKRGLIGPDFVIENPDQGEYQHFGESCVLMNNKTLLVSAPNYSLIDKQRVGKLYAFDMHTNTIQWTMTGSNEFQQFGRVLATDEQNILAVSSPSEETRIGLQKFWQGGTVRIYDWKKMNVEGSSPVNFQMEHGLISVIQGGSNAGHLGQSLSINKYGNKIWIGEPMSEQENGRIYKWSIDGNEGLECIKNNHVLLARFGSQIGSVGPDNICITSQRYGQNARYSGAVTLLQTK